MSENNKTEEFLQKLAPCIERGDIDACVEEAARLAREMGIRTGDLLDLSTQWGKGGKYAFAYVLALAAAHGLEGKAKADAYYNAGMGAGFLGRKEKQEQHYKLAIEADPNDAEAHYNYANLLSEQKRNDEAEQHFKLAIDADPTYAATHYNYAILLYKQKKFEEAETHFKLAISANPKYVEAHTYYANADKRRFVVPAISSSLVLINANRQNNHFFAPFAYFAVKNSSNHSKPVRKLPILKVGVKQP